MKLITDFANFGVHLNHSPFGLGIPFVDKSLCTSLSVKVVPSLLIAYSSKRILKGIFPGLDVGYCCLTLSKTLPVV